MNNPFISLLFPSEEKRASHALPEGRPNISDVVCDEIGLSTLLDLRGSSLSEYFTVDEEVIRYREATIADMIALPRSCTISPSSDALTAISAPPRASRICTALPRSSFTSA